MLTCFASISYATDIPKDFADSVRFANVLGPLKLNKIDEVRFLKTMFYLANELHVTDKQQPRILIVALDNTVAEWTGIKELDGLMMYVNNTKKDVVYELYISEELKDSKMLLFLANVYRKTFDLEDAKLIAATNTVYKYLLEEHHDTVDVKDLKK